MKNPSQKTGTDHELGRGLTTSWRQTGGVVVPRNTSSEGVYVALACHNIVGTS